MPALTRSILVVDHNDDVREMVAELFRVHGHVVHVASNGADALELAKLVKPDVVFLELALPALDGFAVARSLRLELGERVLLIAWTGLKTEETERAAEHAGFNEYLLKPQQADVLLKIVAPRPLNGRLQRYGPN